MAARVALTGGAYTAKSLIANAQRCVNLYPENNPESSQAPTPVTHYTTPGLVDIFRPARGCVRGEYRATNGALYVVIGNAVYFVDLVINYGYTFMGNITAGHTPVSMSDNGEVVVLVDGTSQGYWWPVGANNFPTEFHEIADVAFYGSTFVCYLDGWFVFNRPGTTQFYLSPNFWNGTDPFDPLYIASKIGGPDQIIAIAVIHRELWLIGQITSEVWYNEGNVDFPFARLPGVFLQHGMLRGWSIAQADVALFWLGRDPQGQSVVFKSANYGAQRISTHAIENAIQDYDVVSDAVGFCYQQEGHTFYVLTFPTADHTWVYDLATELWHERTWTDESGVEHRSRVNCAVNAYNKIICGDWENGKLYYWDLDEGTDAGDPIVRRRGFPHLLKDGRRVSYDSIILDMQVGTPPSADLSYTAQSSYLQDGPQVLLRWSDTRGASWGNTVAIAFGFTGDYERSLLLRNLGMARDRVFEVYWSFPYKTALQGAWITATPAET